MVDTTAPTGPQRKRKEQQQEQASREHLLQMRLEGHHAKGCRVAVYNLNDTAFQQQQQPDLTTIWWNDGGRAYATDWWRGDQATRGQQIVATAPQGMQTQQQHEIQQPVQQGQAVSGLLIAMTTHTSNFVNVHHDNIIDLMIDSAAATHVCPHWFAPKFQFNQLTKGDEPQLRTVTNTQIKVHGYKYVIMRNNKKQPIVIPFYVFGLHAPILSVIQLAEQGFNIQLNETPTMTHKHGLQAQLIQKEGLYFMRAGMIQLPPGSALTVKDTEAGQLGMVAPMAMSDTGMLAPMRLAPTSVMPQAGGGNAD